MNNPLRNKWLLKSALLAGAAGGLAEMAWITLYSSTPSADVARQVTATLLPGALEAVWAPFAGVIIHMALSVAVALAFVAVMWNLCRAAPAAPVIWISATAALAGIWAANFLWALPALNPAFPALLPYGVTLASKLLFAVAMAAVLHACRSRALPQAGRRRPFPVRGLNHPLER